MYDLPPLVHHGGGVAPRSQRHLRAPPTSGSSRQLRRLYGAAAAHLGVPVTAVQPGLRIVLAFPLSTPDLAFCRRQGARPKTRLFFRRTTVGWNSDRSVSMLLLHPVWQQGRDHFGILLEPFWIFFFYFVTYYAKTTSTKNQFP